MTLQGSEWSCKEIAPTPLLILLAHKRLGSSPQGRLLGNPFALAALGRLPGRLS